MSNRTQKQAPDLHKSDSYVELLLDLLSGWLITASLCLLVDAQFPTVAGVVTILWHTAVVLVVALLLTRRWWLLPATFGVALVGAILWLLPPENLIEKLTLTKEFFLWWFANLPLDSPWYTPQTMVVVHWLIHIGISALVFTMLRLIRLSWPLLLLGVAVEVFIFIVGDTSNSALSVALLLAGSFPLLARDRYAGRQMFSRRTRNNATVPQWMVSVVSGVMCVAVAGVTLAAMPQDTSGLRLRPFVNATADLQTVSGYYSTEQRENTDITLIDLGLQPNKFRLGGDLVPQASRVLATTNLTEQTLVKVTTFDTFTGKNWTNEFDVGYRIDSWWKNKQTHYLNNQVISNPAAEDALDVLTQRQDVTITLQEPTYLLPTVGQTVSVTELVSSKNALHCNARSELLTYTFPQKPGFSYTLDSLTMPLENTLTKPMFAAIVDIALAEEDRLLKDDAFFFHYTALPKVVTDKFKQRTYDITDDVSTKLEAVLILSRYFSLDNGYRYVENPGKTEYNDNIIDHMLRTKQGYCVHYATAMAMMARIIEVPSRLAAGYKTVTGPDGTQIIDASQPYVWVECYLQNVGWIAFDPTPGSGYTPGTFDPDEEIPPQLQMPDKEEQKEPANTDEEVEEEEKPREPISWSVPLFLLLLALAWLILRGCLSYRFYLLVDVRRRYRHSTRRQMQHYYQDILRQLRLMGYALQPGETLYELLERFGATQEAQTAATIRDHLQPLVEMHYAGKEPTPQQVEAMDTLHTALEFTLHHRMNGFLYVLRRRVLLPSFSFVTYRY